MIIELERPVKMEKIERWCEGVKRTITRLHDMLYRGIIGLIEFFRDRLCFTASKLLWGLCA
jgi:hypothetical protein